jgi:hypothetical protein
MDEKTGQLSGSEADFTPEEDKLIIEMFDSKFSKEGFIANDADAIAELKAIFDGKE